MTRDDLLVAIIIQYDSVIIERRPKVVTVLLHGISSEYCVGKLGRHDTGEDGRNGRIVTICGFYI